MKTCTKCKTSKDASGFYKDTSRPDGLAGWCKACSAATSKKHWHNPEQRAIKIPKLRERARLYRQRVRRDGLCYGCAQPLQDRQGRKMCSPCAAKAAAYQRGYKRKAKLECLAAYGGVICACCGETNDRFLTLDHVNNDGKAHRIAVLGSSRVTGMYDWVRRNNFPPGFQVLCFNCNCGRSINKGICPHEEERQTTPSVELMAC